MWQRWYKHQCVAVGFAGCPLEGPTKNRGWSRTRNALKAIQVGDLVVVALSEHRVGRIGQVTELPNEKWEALVPPSSERPVGEMGRRILVRWDMTTGPDDRDLVLLLPEGNRFTSGELRPTLCKIHSRTFQQLKKVMDDKANWVGLDTYFDYETALQGYIAAYPHRLEDGLLPHPDKKIREKVFKDRKRVDVMLVDREERPVIIECKRGNPSARDVDQLRGYMRQLAKETGREPRGILVHGGALKLSSAVRKKAAERGRVEIVRYRLDVDFDLCR